MSARLSASALARFCAMSWMARARSPISSWRSVSTISVPTPAPSSRALLPPARAGAGDRAGEDEDRQQQQHHHAGYERGDEPEGEARSPGQLGRPIAEEPQLFAMEGGEELAGFIHDRLALTQTNLIRGRLEPLRAPQRHQACSVFDHTPTDLAQRGDAPQLRRVVGDERLQLGQIAR